MSEPAGTSVWPILIYRDAPAAITFLTEAFGFTAAAVFKDENDPTVVHHAELMWPRGGGVMVSSASAGSEPFTSVVPGSSLVYLVTDEPDALYARARAAGAKIARELRDESYGSRDFAVADPEGNLWSFGTYAGDSPAP